MLKGAIENLEIIMIIIMIMIIIIIAFAKRHPKLVTRKNRDFSGRTSK